MKPRAPLFRDVPEDLSALSIDELRELETEFQSTARQIAANDQELLGVPGSPDAVPPESVIEQMTAGVEQLERIRAAIGSVEQEEATYTETVGDLAAQFGVTGEEAPLDEAAPAADDEPAEDDEPAAEASAETDDEESAAAEAAPEPEPTAAALRVRRPAPAAPASHQPRAAEEDTGPKAAPLIAAGGLETVVRPGQKLSRKELAVALAEADRLTQGTRGKSKVIVASARFDFPEERMLTTKDPDGNWDKIRALTDLNFASEAVVASGGFCAPYPPLYDLPIIATAARPVRDFLPGFGVERGGITFPTPLGLSDVVDGISVITAAQDEAGGSLGTKACVRIDCDPFQSAEVQAIAACVEHGNLNARAWPERVANVADLLAAAHAQAAETELLAALTAGSTAVTDERKYGAFSTVVQGALKAAAAYRSRHRMDPDAVLQSLWPAWIVDAVTADLAHNGFTRLDSNVVRSMIKGYLMRANIDVAFYIDQDGTTTQTYGAQGATALLEFLTSVKWYLFHRGAWLFLDFGRLDLGVTRDSDLNSTNDFNVMWETFEGAAFVGIESLAIVTALCPTGETAGTVPSNNTVDDFFACAA